MTNDRDKILYSIGVDKLYIVTLLGFCILFWGFLWFLRSSVNDSYKKFSLFIMMLLCVAFIIAATFFVRDVNTDRKDFDKIAESLPFKIYVESYELFWRDSNQLFSRY